MSSCWPSEEETPCQAHARNGCDPTQGSRSEKSGGKQNPHDKHAHGFPRLSQAKACEELQLIEGMCRKLGPEGLASGGG